MTNIIHLEETPVHLGLGARVIVQEPNTPAADWYERYAERTSEDGVEGRLVATYPTDESWGHWEMHPSGDELVLCLSGSMTLYQDSEGVISSYVLSAGEATINPKGVWHTCDVDGPAKALYITAGLGTEHKERLPH